MTTAAIILAAGFSRRLGRPKQAVIFGGTTLLERAIRTAREADLHPILVVVNDTSSISSHTAKDVTVLVNNNAEQGMSTSIHTGVRWLQQTTVTGVVVMACDQPALQPAHLRALCAEPNRITGSRYANRSGVPAFFPAAIFASLLELRGDTGARTLLQHADFVPNEALALDIDTEDDLRRAEEALALNLT